MKLTCYLSALHRITMGLTAVLCCNMAVGQENEVTVSPQWKLDYIIGLNPAFSRDTARSMDEIAWVKHRIRTRLDELVDLDSCEVSYNYNAIFSPQGWAEFSPYSEREMRKKMSTSGASCGFYHWWFTGIDTPIAAKEARRRSDDGYHCAVQATVYRFDEENKLLYVKWSGQGSHSRELVLRPSLYRSTKEHREVVLVLFAYPHATWAMPAAEIITQEAEYYNTFTSNTYKK